MTGVSTGTLIAPFAFLGDESIDQIEPLSQPAEGLGEASRSCKLLPDNISFAEVLGLERDSL